MASPRVHSARRVHVRINPIRCVAHGYCAEFCPEVFTLDDWGYASIVRNDVSDDLLELLNRTANLCPTGAITVEQTDASPVIRSATRDNRSPGRSRTRKNG